MLDQPVVGVDGTFYFADGKGIRFRILPDGTVRQASDEDDLTEAERRRRLASAQILHGLRDALLDSGLGEVERGSAEIVPVPD